MSRRGDGEGTIHKRKDGRWAGTIDLGWHDGKRKRKSVYGKTRKEAADKLKALQRQLDDGLPVTDERTTVEEYLTWWLTEALPNTVRPSTLESYESKVRLHIIPTLGKVRLAQLAPAQVQRLVNDKLESGLSPRSVQYIHAVLRRALGQAEKWGLVPRNVAKLVDPPKVETKEISPLSPEDAKGFLQAAEKDRLYALYAVAVAMGLRQGETLGLRWSDVDLDEGVLRVRQQVRRVNRKLEFSEPKSARSRRSIALPTVCVDALRDHRAHQAEERLRAGDSWEDCDLVFPTPTGTPTDARNLIRRFKRLLNEAGLPEIRFHDLRHTCASLLLAQGVPTRVVMEVLGHSQMALTTDTYQHVMPELKTEAADQMDEALRLSDTA